MRRRQISVAQALLGTGLVGAVVGGVILLRTLAAALDRAGVAPAAAAHVRGSVAAVMVLLAILTVLTAALLGGLVARSAARMRAHVLGQARGDESVPPPTVHFTEIAGIGSAVTRLAAHASTREAELQRSSAELSVLLDAITDGILQLGPGGRIVLANPAARAMLRLTQVAIGQPVAAHVRNAELRRILERAAAGEPVRLSEVAVDERRLLVSARPLAGTADLTGEGAVVAFADITELRRLEGVRRDFVANVSHELKTPLTSIRGYAETMLHDDLPPDMQRQFLEVVHRNAERLHSIVDDLLDLSRLESGGWRPEPLEVDSLDVVDDVWSTCAERASRRGVTFIRPAESLAVHADPGGLRQVLSNLIDNALRYTPDCGSIEVRTSVEAPFVVFEVRDTGTGIPSEALPRIFERFYRVDPARSRADGGTGLGLSIVKHLVESMGGTVSAESELGKGTVIRFRLPAAV